MSGDAITLVAAGAPVDSLVALGAAGWAGPVLAQGAQGMTREEIQQLKNDVQQSVREQIDAARAQMEAARAARAGAQAQGLPPVPPTPPVVRVDQHGRIITVDASGAHTTVAGQGVPSDIPDLPQSIVVVCLAFFVMLAFIAVGWPLARAFARRIDRQSAAGGGASGFPADVGDRIERIEHAVEAIAIEVERISEGQRFTTRLLSELRPDALPAGAPARRP